MTPLQFRIPVGICSLMLTVAPLLHPVYGEEKSQPTAMEIPHEEILPYLVLISYHVDGRKESGHGVIIQMEDKPYLLTNQHILLGAERISFLSADGERLSPRSIELSNSRDLARLALPESVGPGLTLSTQVKMNMPIAVYFRGGGGSPKIEEGRVIGVGSGAFEISAEFERSGNGAPVLNPDKEVIGVTTYSRESSFSIFKTGSRFQESTRYFCSRFDKNDWRRVNWKSFNSKFGRTYREHDLFYDELMDIFDKWKSPHESAEKAAHLAGECRTHARQLRKLSEQKGLTEFLLNDFESKAALFESANGELVVYAKRKR